MHRKWRTINDIISDTNFAHRQPSITRETLTSVIERDLKSIHGLALNTRKQKVDPGVELEQNK
jgi:hypothetical protein